MTHGPERVRPAPLSIGSRDGVTRYVALLRAVNVGGKNSLPRGELRAALREHYPDVATVLQSGNALFTSERSASATASDISRTIEDAFGLRVAVVVRSAAEIESIVQRNPFLAVDVAPTRLSSTSHFSNGIRPPKRSGASTRLGRLRTPSWPRDARSTSPIRTAPQVHA